MFLLVLSQHSSEGFREQDSIWGTHKQKNSVWKKQFSRSLESVVTLPCSQSVIWWNGLDACWRFIKGCRNSHFSKWLLRDGCSYHDSSTSMFNTWLKTLCNENLLFSFYKLKLDQIFFHNNKQSETIYLVLKISLPVTIQLLLFLKKNFVFTNIQIRQDFVLTKALDKSSLYSCCAGCLINTFFVFVFIKDKWHAANTF